ncbi:hypothetical protein B0H19DRAFT_705230 [Mycena capillaripes]|nr:hypothetical protein B0H19DRAFT_705230 [Mycena capillaripes]
MGKYLFHVSPEIRMSVLLNPFYELPALFAHWRLTGTFVSRGQLDHAPSLVLDAATRKINVRHMVYGLCERVCPASLGDELPVLLKFVADLGDSNGM